MRRFLKNVSSKRLTGQGQRHEPKPSAKLVKFKKDLLITNEDRAEALDHFIKGLRNKNPSA